MNEKVLKTLEYNKIINMLKDEAGSDLGRMLCGELKPSNDLNEMDSELFRAKKIIKVMFTRAAGDKCLRILALLVLLAVIAVIVVECVKPGSVKKSTEGWFNVENGNITTSKLF